MPPGIGDVVDGLEPPTCNDPVSALGRMAVDRSTASRSSHRQGSRCSRPRWGTRKNRDPHTHQRDPRTAGWALGLCTRADGRLPPWRSRDRKSPRPARWDSLPHPPTPYTAAADRPRKGRRLGPKRTWHRRSSGRSSPRLHPRPSLHPGQHLGRPPRRSYTADSGSARKRNRWAATMCYPSAWSAPCPSSSR